MKNFTVILTSFFIISMMGILKAQTFTLIPGDFITEDITLDYFNNVQVDMSHPEYDDITFGWVTVSVDFPKDWTYESCDNGGCYGQLPDSAMVGPLPDTVPGYVRITINPWQQEGVGTAKLYIYNTKFPDDGKFVEFEIIASAVTSVAENHISPIEIFPNPATDFMRLKNHSDQPTTFEILDMTGKVLKVDFIEAGQEKLLQLSHYPKGIYFVRYQQQSGLQTKKVIIQ